jgi:hypothetical protein
MRHTGRLVASSRPDGSRNQNARMVPAFAVPGYRDRMAIFSCRRQSARAIIKEHDHVWGFDLRGCNCYSRDAGGGREGPARKTQAGGS